MSFWPPDQPELEAPLPASFEEALKEIVRLRRLLIQQNARLANKSEKSELDRRAVIEQLAAERQKRQDLERQLAEKRSDAKGPT